MANNTISALAIEPRTDNPVQEAYELTNAFKKCIQDIAAPQALNVLSYDDYISVVVPEPNQPSEHSAKSKAKSYEHLHFWSGLQPWLKLKLFGNDGDWKKYQARKQRVKENTEAIYAQAFAQYTRELQECNKKRAELSDLFKQQDQEIINDYFRYALENDQFSIDYFNTYSIGVDYIQYNDRKNELQVCYRIPSSGEILPLDYFFFDEKEQLIKDKQLSSGIAVQFRNDVARRVLLRAAATIFLSDEDDIIQQIQMHGYLTDEMDNGRLITVIKLVFPRNDVLNNSPEFIDMKADFRDLFQEERSNELYTIEPYQLRELLNRPRMTNVTQQRKPIPKRSRAKR